MSFQVTLRPSGKMFEVPEGQRVLTAAIAAGVSLPYSCRNGTCLTCVGNILEGQVDETKGRIPHEFRDDKRALLCQTAPITDLVIEIEEAPATFTPRQRKIIVNRMRRVASDVMVLDLKLPISTPMRFKAGQYIDLLFPDGRRRSYSLANAPSLEGDADLQVHIRLTPGGAFTEFVFDGMKERDLFNCEGPLGSFFLREDSDKPIVFVASGTGYAPVRAIIKTELERGKGRRMKLYWGCRSKQDLYMIDEPLEWARNHERFEFIPVLSDASPADAWEGRAGFVHRAVMDDLPDLSQHQVYACGAPAMIDAAREDFTARCKLPSAEFYADAFLTEADFAAAD